VAQILDFNTPSVAPAGAPGNDYLRINANPNMFGAQTAQAVEKLGGAFEKAGNDVTQIAEFQNRIDVDDQTNKFLDTRNKLLYGDPSKQTIGPDGQPAIDRGFMGLEGRAASDARDGMLKQLEEARQAGKGNLRNPMAQLAYDQQTRRLYNESETHVGAHTDQQWKVWAGGVNAAGANHELNDFVNAVGDPAKMEGYAHNYINFKVQQAQIKFGDDAGIKSQAEAQAKVELLEAHVNAVAVRDPARAIQILDSNKQTAGVKYDDMYNRLRNRSNQQLGDEASQRAILGARSGNFSVPVNDAIRVAASQSGVDPAVLTRSAQIESGGDPGSNRDKPTKYKGLFNLDPDEFKKYGPPGGDIYNANDNALAAAAKMKAEGNQFASINGRQPNGFDQYMIHQQGVAGYSAHLNNPNAPAWQNMLSTGEGQEKGEGWARKAIWGNIPDQYKTTFGSVDNVTSRDFLAMWQAKFGQSGIAAGGFTQTAGSAAPQFGFPREEMIYGGQGRAAIQAGAFPVPNVASVIKPTAMQNLLDDPTLRNNPEAFDQAYRKVTVALNAQEIAENQKTKAKTEASDKAAGGYIVDIAGGMHSPNYDFVALAGRITQDPSLTWQTKQHLLDRVAKFSGEEHALAQMQSYGPGYLAAREGLFSPPDAPGHITDFSQLVQHNDITLAGLQDLNTRMKLARGSVDRHAFEQRLSSVLGGAKKMISFEEDTGFFKLRDPKGEQTFALEFQPLFIKQATDLADEAEKTGDQTKLNKFLEAGNVRALVEQYRPKRQMDQDKLMATGSATAEKGEPEKNPPPPTPEGVNPAGWVPLVSSPPATASGKRWPMQQWAQYLDGLRKDPSEENKAEFNATFGKLGLNADKVLEGFRVQEAKPAAPQAAPTSPAPVAPPVEMPRVGPALSEEFKREQEDPSNPAVKFRKWIEMGLNPGAAREKRHQESPPLDHGAHSEWRDGR
jgi:hypothetical protein